MMSEPQTGDGSAVAITAGVLWLRMPLFASLKWINVWAIADGDGWALVDTGLNSPETLHAWSAAFAGPMTGRPATRVLVTHMHPDHCGMAGWLPLRYGRLARGAIQSGIVDESARVSHLQGHGCRYGSRPSQRRSGLLSSRRLGSLRNRCLQGEVRRVRPDDSCPSRLLSSPPGSRALENRGLRVARRHGQRAFTRACVPSLSRS